MTGFNHSPQADTGLGTRCQFAFYAITSHDMKSILP